MSDLNVKVKNGEFQPQSQTGVPGQTVKFKNDRSAAVTITLAPNFYSQGTLNIHSGDTKDVTILSTATGTGPFSAPQAGVAQDGVQGDIRINPSK